jgi:hypothetical protein
MNWRRVVVALCVAIAVGCRPYIPERVTTDGLLAIKPGMPYDQVVAVIGHPLCYAGSCFGQPTAVPQEFLQARTLNLSYARPSAGDPFFSPAIYINLTKGHVEEVYIKHNDYGICCKEGLATSPYYSNGSRELLLELIGR